jgi:hypothetical protein
MPGTLMMTWSLQHVGRSALHLLINLVNNVTNQSGSLDVNCLKHVSDNATRQ